jgi:apolipoprotein D and lipocalin family protein
MKQTSLTLVLVALATVAQAREPLATVEKVDLDRYLGTWYEIGSNPAWFAKNCTGVTAEYSKRDDGMIQVVNRCYKNSLDGKLKEAKGRAKIVDDQTFAKLKVSFFGPFWGDYWIIDLDTDYAWAVVGEPKRKYLWILSRTPALDKETLDGILLRLPAQGYDTDNLQWTPQADTGETP